MLTGEPYAGDPHVRFGGRGGAIQCVVPTPIRARPVGLLSSVNILLIPEAFATSGHEAENEANFRGTILEELEDGVRLNM